MSYLEALLFAIPIFVVFSTIGFFLQVRKQSKWSNAPIVDTLDAQSHAEAIQHVLRQRVGSLDFGTKEIGYRNCKAAEAAAVSDPKDLELMIAQFHFIGYTIDFVPVDQLPEEIPGERIVINPLVKS